MSRDTSSFYAFMGPKMFYAWVAAIAVFSFCFGYLVAG